VTGLDKIGEMRLDRISEVCYTTLLFKPLLSTGEAFFGDRNVKFEVIQEASIVAQKPTVFYPEIQFTKT
jgi:hypothetical protein